MGSVITRPFTLEPIQRSLRDALTDLAIELEEEGNLPEDVAETATLAVAEVLNEQYGPLITRQALLTAVKHIQQSPADTRAFPVPLPEADQDGQRMTP